MNAYARAVTLLILLSFLAVTLCAQEAVTDSYYQAAAEAAERGDYAAAARFARLGLAEIEKFGPPGTAAARRLKVKGLNLLSGALIESESYSKAEKIRREEIALLEGLRGGDYPEYSTNYPMSLESLGFILAEQEKFAEAEEAYRKALSYREGVYGPKDKAVATSLVNLGELYFRQRKLAESEVMSRRALSLLGEAFEAGEMKQSDIPVFLRAARSLARVDVESKRHAEAEKTYKFIIEAVERFYGRSDPSLIEPLEEYAALLRAMRRPTEAARIESRLRLLKRQ